MGPLGWCDVCLNVKDVAASLAFYRKLGFEVAEGNADDKYYVVVNEAVRIGLYQGHLTDAFSLNFRGGDVMAISEALKAEGVAFESGPKREKDNSEAATVRDPDGHMIFLNTHPMELERGYQEKIGVHEDVIDRLESSRT